MLTLKFMQRTKGTLMAALLLGGAALAQSAGAVSGARGQPPAPAPINHTYIAPEFAQGNAHPPMPSVMLNRKREVDPLLANLTVKKSVTRKLGDDFEARDGKIYLKKPIREEDRKKAEIQQQAAKALPGIAQNQMDGLLKNIPGAALGPGGEPQGAAQNKNAAEAAMRMLPQGAFAQPVTSQDAEAPPEE